MGRRWIGAVAAAMAILAAGAPASAVAQDARDSYAAFCPTILKMAQSRLIVLGTAAQNVFSHAEPGPEAWRARFDAEYDEVMRLLGVYRDCVQKFGTPDEPPPSPGPGVIITEPGAPEPQEAAPILPPPPPVIVEPPLPPAWYRPPPREPRTRDGWRQRLRPGAERPRDRRQKGGRTPRGPRNCHTNPVTGKLDCNEG